MYDDTLCPLQKISKKVKKLQKSTPATAKWAENTDREHMLIWMWKTGSYKLLMVSGALKSRTECSPNGRPAAGVYKDILIIFMLWGTEKGSKETRTTEEWGGGSGKGKTQRGVYRLWLPTSLMTWEWSTCRTLIEIQIKTKDLNREWNCWTNWDSIVHACEKRCHLQLRKQYHWWKAAGSTSPPLNNS